MREKCRQLGIDSERQSQTETQLGGRRIHAGGGRSYRSVEPSTRGVQIAAGTTSNKSLCLPQLTLFISLSLSPAPPPPSGTQSRFPGGRRAPNRTFHVEYFVVQACFRTIIPRDAAIMTLPSADPSRMLIAAKCMQAWPSRPLRAIWGAARTIPPSPRTSHYKP